MWRRLFGLSKLGGAAFTDLVAKLGVESGRFQHPVVDREAMKITDNHEVMNLANMYAQFLALPRAERLTYIRDHVLSPPPEPPGTWAEASSTLLPTIRDPAYLAIAQLQLKSASGGNAQAIAYRLLIDGLFETVVIDTPRRMITVSHEQCERWGITADTAFETARANLRKTSQDAFTALIPGLWTAPWNDSYAAARIVLPDILQRVCTDPLVVVPDRDTLIVADPRRPGIFEPLVALLEKLGGTSKYPITRRIHQLEHKALRPYAPPPGAHLARYERLLAEELVQSYEQEADLQNQAGGDAFWAKVIAMVTPEGEICTWAVWTRGVVEGYLPPVQTICFVEPDEPNARTWEVPWSVVAAEPGMLTPTDALLPRWKIGAFPSAAWLAQHGQRKA